MEGSPRWHPPAPSPKRSLDSVVGGAARSGAVRCLDAGRRGLKRLGEARTPDFELRLFTALRAVRRPDEELRCGHSNAGPPRTWSRRAGVSLSAT